MVAPPEVKWGRSATTCCQAGSLGWPVSVSMGASVLAALAFNWLFVPPRGTLSVDLGEHALLLAAMCVVNWIVAGLMASQRAQLFGLQQMAP